MLYKLLIVRRRTPTPPGMTPALTLPLTRSRARTSDFEGFHKESNSHSGSSEAPPVSTFDVTATTGSTRDPLCPLQAAKWQNGNWRYVCQDLGVHPVFP